MLLYEEEESIYRERLELAENRILELLEELSGGIEQGGEVCAEAGSQAGKNGGDRGRFLLYFGSQFSFCNVCSKLNKYLRNGNGEADSLEE